MPPGKSLKHQTRIIRLLRQPWPCLLVMVFVIGILFLGPSARGAFDPNFPPGSYTPPGGQSPNYSLDTLKFLNPSSVTQQKKGSLIIGSSAEPGKFCLNPNPNNGAQDPGNCISSWVDVAGDLTGALRFYKVSATATAVPNSLTDFPSIQNGYVRVKNDASKNQRYGIILGGTTKSTLSSGAALYATNAGISTNWAGYFVGGTVIKNASQNASLCLNGTTMVQYNPSSGGNCIKNWSDLFFGSSALGYLHLLNGSGSGDVGQVALTKGFFSGAIVIGTPVSFSGALTCGDGFCSAGEPSCPSDCAAILPPSTFTATSSGPTQVNISYRTAVAPGGPQGYALILKKTGSAPTFVPQDGNYYRTGDIVGDASIYYATAIGSPAGANQNISIPADTAVSVGTTYYYQAFEANRILRYSPGSALPAVGVSPSLPTYQVAAAKNVTAGGTISIAPTGGTFPCGPSCASASATYSSGTTVQLTATPNTGYTFSSWSGNCSGSSTCTLASLNGNKNVTANFTQVVTLTLVVSNAAGVGSGTVTHVSPSLPAVNCGTGATCNYVYPISTMVTLRANPGTNSDFRNWTGCTSTPTATTCQVSMSQSKTVTAVFGQVSGGGGGGGGGEGEIGG